MPLVTSNIMLLDAQRHGYAIGAFNVENMEMAQAVLRAAEVAGMPVILQTTPSTVKYGGLKLFAAMISALATDAKIPAALHLDHGTGYELALSAFYNGYTSVMVDGSQLPFEENIAITRRTVEMAKVCGIPVEAELGTVGGKEDGLEAGNSNYTEPSKAKEFVERTGIQSLAVAIGTAHGVYKERPQLDVERLKSIRGVVDIPLVLHGASGLSDEQIRSCVKEGICKVNFATELRIAYTAGVKRYIEENPGVIDPKSFGKAAGKAVEQVVMERIAVCAAKG